MCNKCKLRKEACIFQKKVLNLYPQVFPTAAEINSITVHDNLNINFTNGDNSGDEVSAIAALPL